MEGLGTRVHICTSTSIPDRRFNPGFRASALHSLAFITLQLNVLQNTLRKYKAQMQGNETICQMSRDEKILKYCSVENFTYNYTGVMLEYRCQQAGSQVTVEET